MLKIELATYSTALVLTYDELKQLHTYLQLSKNALPYALQGCSFNDSEKESLKLCDELIDYCTKQIEHTEF